MRLEYVARPSGRKPAAVYWRRRAVFLTLALLLLWFGAKACGGSGSGRPTAAGAAGSPSTRSTGQGTGHAAAGGGKATAAPTPTPVASRQGVAVAPATMCDLSTISLRAAVDRDAVRRPVGNDALQISLQLSTRASNACGVDPSSLTAQVLDGSRVVWSSGGCPATGDSSSSATGVTGAAATPGTGPTSSGAPDAGPEIAVPSQSAVTQHFTWRGSSCGGPLVPGRYDVVGRIALAQAYAGTITVS